MVLHIMKTNYSFFNRTDSDNCGGMKRFLKKREDLLTEYQKELIKFERSRQLDRQELFWLMAKIDVTFHRGT